MYGAMSGQSVRLGLASRGRDVDGVADERGVDVDVGYGPLKRNQVLERQRLAQLGRLDELPLDDGQLLVVSRVSDHDLEHEPVYLRLGQRVGAFGLDRVLRGHHEERLGNGIGRMRNRHLAFLHHLEERGLHLRRSTVDLVGKQEVAEDRSELRVELTVAHAVDTRSDEVGRNEIGSELHASKRPAQDSRSRLDRQRLGETRDALDQEVALCEQADEHSLEHFVLPGDDAPDLEQRLLELFFRLRRGGDGGFVRLLSHVALLLSWLVDIGPIRKQTKLSLG